MQLALGTVDGLVEACEDAVVQLAHTAATRRRYLGHLLSSFSTRSLPLSLFRGYGPDQSVEKRAFLFLASNFKHCF